MVNGGSSRGSARRARPAGGELVAAPGMTAPPAAPIRPAWLVITFTVLVALTPAMPHVALGTTGVDVTDVLPILAALIAVGGVIRYRLWRSIAPRRAPEAWALAAIVPFTLIAALSAGSIHSLFAGPARWALNAMIVAAAYAVLRTRLDGLRMLRAITIVATAEALFGLISYAVRFSGPGGNIGISITQGKIGGMAVWGRITGTTGMSATFIAGLFALALPVAVGLAMAAAPGRRWPWITSSVVLFAGLLLTLSRVPIALGTAAVIVLLLASTRMRVWLPILVTGSIFFLATPLRARMTDFSGGRIPLWRVGWRMFTDNWATGVGPGNYLRFEPLYRIPGLDSEPVTPHNSLLYLASESGVFAALALAVAIGFSLRFLGRRNPLVLAPMLGVAAFCINAMTTNLYSIASIAVACWMMAPAVAAIRRATVDDDNDS